jgi:hypothetical protein
MSNFNTKLVEYLDLFNHCLALVFIFLGIFKFVELVRENFLGAILESITLIGFGILTCGYIALMININNILTQIRDGVKND